MAEDEIIGTAEVAERLGVHIRTAQRRIKDAVDTDTITVIHKAGRGHEYLLRASDLPKLTE